MAMATKLDRVATFGGGTPPSKSCDLLIIWSREKLKKLVSALSQCLWPSDLPWW